MEKNTVKGSQKTNNKQQKNSTHVIDKELIFLIYKELSESVRIMYTEK